ncbi:putative glucan 1,3-beta-glucosidase precursor [Pyronema domesticum]|nr:putative glucan 1,3-beta-glucosidase precursor [Pyronema domesticum]
MVNDIRIRQPTATDITRYRLHHGVNLGGIFCLERWLFPSMFAGNAKGNSELAAVTAYVETHGTEKARGKWEQHWINSMKPSDWEFLKAVGKVTSVRLPIGWFTLGAWCCKGTAFEPVSGVYQNAWSHVKRYVYTASEYGIGTLIDLHALPGGANADAHSGTDSGKAGLWEKAEYRKIATQACVYIAQQIEMDPVMQQWVVGLQIVNEAAYSEWGVGGHAKEWYTETLPRVAEMSPSLPVYISDAWNTKAATKWASERNQGVWDNTALRGPIIVDIHKYYCFDSSDKELNAGEIISRIPSGLSDLNEVQENPVGTIVGEYSCVLSEETWSKSTPQQRVDLIHMFGLAQLNNWERPGHANNGGAYFWTGKMDWMDGGEWGFVEQTKKGNIPPPASLTFSFEKREQIAERARRKHVQLQTAALKEHVDYWTKQVSEQMEHWRYEMGFTVGFVDALNFWRMRGATVGFVNLWAGKRLREHVLEHAGNGTRAYLWEFEHGVRRALRDFEQILNKAAQEK